MNCRNIYILVLLWACCMQGKAQQAKALTFQWTLRGSRYNYTTISDSFKGNTPFLEENKYEKPCLFIVATPGKLTYTLPKAAIFCRMEDAVYEKFNVLFKIRMGNNGCSD